MARPAWVKDLIKKLFVKDLEKAAITRWPGVGKAVEKMLFDGDHLICLPRDQTVPVNQELDPAEQMVLPSELVGHFIDRASFLFVMDFCICRHSMDCTDFPVEYGCIFMGEAARDINPEWGRAVSRRQAREHLEKCQEAGLVHFIGKSKLDTVWLGAHPGEKLLTVCNCCPCCCITRGLPHVSDNLARLLHRAPGVQVEVNRDLCVGCGICAKDVCFVQAISLNGEAASISTDCRGCGRCVDACPNQAITLRVDPDRFFQESVDTLSKLVEI